MTDDSLLPFSLPSVGRGLQNTASERSFPTGTCSRRLISSSTAATCYGRGSGRWSSNSTNCLSGCHRLMTYSWRTELGDHSRAFGRSPCLPDWTCSHVWTNCAQQRLALPYRCESKWCPTIAGSSSRFWSKFSMLHILGMSSSQADVRGYLSLAIAIDRGRLLTFGQATAFTEQPNDLATRNLWLPTS
jgi:hypothetical protein